MASAQPAVFPLKRGVLTKKKVDQGPFQVFVTLFADSEKVRKENFHEQDRRLHKVGKGRFAIQMWIPGKNFLKRSLIAIKAANPSGA